MPRSFSRLWSTARRSQRRADGGDVGAEVEPRYEAAGQVIVDTKTGQAVPIPPLRSDNSSSRKQGGRVAK